jgi:hypothetical protein
MNTFQGHFFYLGIIKDPSFLSLFHTQIGCTRDFVAATECDWLAIEPARREGFCSKLV